VFNVSFVDRLFTHNFCVCLFFFFFKGDVDGKFVVGEGLDDRIQAGIVLDPVVFIVSHE
jgi:hypothetical protein